METCHLDNFGAACLRRSKYEDIEVLKILANMWKGKDELRQCILTTTKRQQALAFSKETQPYFMTYPRDSQLRWMIHTGILTIDIKGVGDIKQMKDIWDV